MVKADSIFEDISKFFKASDLNSFFSVLPDPTPLAKTVNHEQDLELGLRESANLWVAGMLAGMLRSYGAAISQ